MLRICFVDGVRMVAIYIAVPFVVTPFVINVLKEILIQYREKGLKRMKNGNVLFAIPQNYTLQGQLVGHYSNTFKE